MGDRTGIAWTQKTWNPWHGCHKISPGCTNCYMFTEKKQYGQDPNTVVRSKTMFNAPLKWKEPSLVFTCSWSDWFIEEADAWRAEAECVAAKTDHIYQILTKRIARVRRDCSLISREFERWANSWFGVSVEDRKYGLPRIDDLREAIDDTNRFLSIEPLLEDLGAIDLSGIGWVIVGGESGFKRREMEVRWLASIVEQCAAQGVPCFVKQDSAFKSGQQGRIPDDLMRREFPSAFQRVLAPALVIP